MKRHMEIKVINFDMRANLVTFQIVHQSAELSDKVRRMGEFRSGTVSFRVEGSPEFDSEDGVLYGWGSDSYRNGNHICIGISSFKLLEGLVETLNNYMHIESQGKLSIKEEFFRRSK